MIKETYFKATEFNNVKEIVYDVVKRIPENIAYIIKKDGKQEKEKKYRNVTYKELLNLINKLGTALFELGYKGKRIAIIGRNKFEYVLSHLANLLGGIVSVPLDKDLQDDELEQSVIRSKVDAIVFDSKYKDKIDTLKEKATAKIKDYICMEKTEGYIDIDSLLEKGDKLLKKGNKDYINFEIKNDEMNELIFTSGTSSKSKAVMLSQKNIASNIYAMQLVEPLSIGDTNIAFLPYHHVYGSTCMIMMLASGVTTAFPDGLRYIAQNLKEYEVSLFVGVPVLIEAIYKNILREIKRQGKEKAIAFGMKISKFLRIFKIDLRRKIFKQIIDQLGGKLKFIISGGAALDKKISEFFNNIGIQLIQGYGLTETSPVLISEDYKVIRPGSIGRPMINVEVELVDKDEHGIGEIRAKGPSIMLGYYEDEEKTNEVLRDGWFYTGDLAYTDKDGYYFLAGRRKDMIVLKNGKKVFPDELEGIINRIDFVNECMVFGMPKEDGDVKLSVKVVYDKELASKEYPNKSFEEIKEILWEKIKEINKTLPTYKYIKNLILTSEELIKTTTKKIKRGEELKRILAENA